MLSKSDIFCISSVFSNHTVISHILVIHMYIDYLYDFFISTIIHMIPFTFYLTPILHFFYSLLISSYDASSQAHDHSLIKDIHC